MKNVFATVALFSSLAAGFNTNLLIPRSQPHLNRRDDPGQIVITALYNISNYTATLTKLVQNFNIQDVNTLQTDTNNVLGAINAGMAAVQPLGNLTVQDLVALQPVITDVAKGVNTSVQATIDARPQFGGLGPVILNGLETQKNATLAFSAAVAEKIPAAFLSASEQANAPIFNALSNGINFYMTNYTNPNKNVYTSDASSLGSVKSWTAVSAAVMVGLVLCS